MNYIIWIVIISLFVFSCSKEHETVNINHKPKADFTISDEIDHFQLVDKSADPDGNDLTRKWISMSDSIQLVNYYSSSLNNPCILYTGSSDTNNVRVKLLVSDGQLLDSIIKDFRLPKVTLIRRYGLGRILNYEHSNDVSYNWYYDQMGTGTYSSINCGPTSVTMAIKWVNEKFSKTPEDARNAFPSLTEDWGRVAVVNYLNNNSISNKGYNITNIDTIQCEINLGNILILCVDMSYIRTEANPKWHTDKFYPTWSFWGHWFVVKGYKIVDKQVFYEVYDPYSMGLSYSDGSLKGKDRYYRSEDLNQAVMNWDPGVIVISNGAFQSRVRIF